MGWLITKYLLTAAVVVIVSETARRSDKLPAKRYDHGRAPGIVDP